MRGPPALRKPLGAPGTAAREPAPAGRIPTIRAAADRRAPFRLLPFVPAPMPVPLPARPRPGPSHGRVLAWGLAIGIGLAAVFPPTAAAAPAAAEAPRPAASAAEAGPEVPAGWVHALAAYTTPKYPPGFAHFDYVNPQAPRGGTLYLGNPDRRTSFDKYNYWTLRGNSPGGLNIFMFESLATLSQDEPQTMYGLLAESMQLAPDLSSISFRLHPQARFYNGDPVTAADVKHSYDTLTGPHVNPLYSSGYATLGTAVVVDARTIRFELRDPTLDAMFVAGGMPVWSHKWGLGPDGQPKPFDQVVTDLPITSGPYTIARADSGRRLELQRNPDYWAKDLGVRRGFYNFDRIVYRYYKDRAVQMEAFKAGEFDIYKEYSARRWLRQHAGPKWEDGRIVKKSWQTLTGQGIQAYRLNLRRPIFQDIRVRQALDYSYDFENNNRTRVFKRAYSVFNNTDFAAEGLPDAAELALLEPWRAELPPAVFGPAYRPPRTDDDPNGLRRNLRIARDLLAEAGWKTDAQGVLRNGEGQAFEFEYLSPEEGAVRGVAPWMRNLEKLGIRMRVRTVDFALYTRRVKAWDYDMIGIVSQDFAIPSASEYETAWTTAAADEEGSNAYSGLKSRALDALIAKLGTAADIGELRTAAHAIDRVIMHSHPFVPEIYSADQPFSWWNRFGIPAVQPDYFTVDSAIDSYGPWPITTWWLLDPNAPRRR